MKRDLKFEVESLIYNNRGDRFYAVQFITSNDSIMVCHSNNSYVKDKMSEIVEAYNNGNLESYCNEYYFHIYKLSTGELRTVCAFDNLTYFTLINNKPVIIEKPLMVVTI